MFCVLADATFTFRSAGVTYSVSDADLVRVLESTGAARHPDGVKLVLLNGCGTLAACERLAGSKAIPDVIGWIKDAVPVEHCLSMVGTRSFNSTGLVSQGNSLAWLANLRLGPDLFRDMRAVMRNHVLTLQGHPCRKCIQGCRKGV